MSFQRICAVSLHLETDVRGRTMSHLDSEQEETDTYLLLHALDATKAGQQAFVSAL